MLLLPWQYMFRSAVRITVRSGLGLCVCDVSCTGTTTLKQAYTLPVSKDVKVNMSNKTHSRVIRINQNTNKLIACTLKTKELSWEISDYVGEMGKTGHEWQRSAIRSRDGEEEIRLLLSFRMRGFHIVLPRSRRHDTTGFHLPYLCRPSPASQNKYHLTHFCLQEGGNVSVWKARTHLRNCQTVRVHIMYLLRLGEPP